MTDAPVSSFNGQLQVQALQEIAKAINAINQTVASVPVVTLPITTANIANSAVTYPKLQNEAATTLLGNPTGAPAAPSEITLGATLAFSGTALQTAPQTGDVTTSANSFATTIAAAAVTLAKQANLAANSVIGNNTGSPATPIALTQAQLTAMVNPFTSSLSGAVPSSGGGTTNFLRADATWAAPAGGTFAKQADQQVFTSTNTWNKPSGFGAKAYALIECWGGGGGGGRGGVGGAGLGGGGGGYNRRFVLLSSLGATETVTIGGAGSAGAANGNQGGQGGNTTFGTWLTGYGGGGGGQAANTTTAAAGGMGGFPRVLGSTAVSLGNITIGTQYFITSESVGGQGASQTEVGCPCPSPVLVAAADAVQGGGGGGGKSNATTIAAGGSFAGGAGGASGSAGTQPGGGGGGNVNAAAGAGGAGKCVVTVIDGA